MAESLLSFDSDGYVRLFFAMAIIICGYGYVIMGVFIRDALSYILMLFGLTGLSALFFSWYSWIKTCGPVLLI